MLEIEKGIPIPGKKTGHYARVYPWYEMEVGDSVFTEKTNLSGCFGGGRVRASGRRFAQRKVEGGIRIWRIA